MTAVPGFGARREAREDALAMLYEAEIAGGSTAEALRRRQVPPSEYAVDLALGVDADRDDVDAALRRHLHHWRLERLAVVDRALARMAAWELLRRSDVPTGVVLSEAVALATQYCGAESPRFLNGVLRAVANEARGPETVADDDAPDTAADVVAPDAAAVAVAGDVAPDAVAGDVAVDAVAGTAAPDAAVDVVAPDAAVDAVAGTAAPVGVVDVVGPDAAADVVAPDAVAGDVAVDAVAGDVAVDAVAGTAAPDAAVDVVAPDAVADVVGPDAVAGDIAPVAAAGDVALDAVAGAAAPGGVVDAVGPGGVASASTTSSPHRLVLAVPELAGHKTCLRLWRPDDAAALAAAWSDPDIRARLPVPDPFDEAAALRWIRQRPRAWAEGVSADLAVADPASDSVVGEVGLSSFDTTRRAALIGWWIGPGWRGQGRASEAVRLLADWVLTDGGLEAVLAEIHPDNPASAAVARRAGLQQVVPASSDTLLSSANPNRLLFARTRSSP